MYSGEGMVAFVVVVVAVVEGTSIGVVLVCFSRRVMRLTVTMLLPQSLSFLFAGCGTISKVVTVAESPTFLFSCIWSFGGQCWRRVAV
jgi:hypothetical protein